MEITEEKNEVCENLFFLGRKGVFTLASGFTVCYLSGTEGEVSWQFSKKDIIAVRNSCIKNYTNMDDYRGIDFLLTSQWPAQMAEGEANTSKLLSFLSLGVKPRYHFCGLNNKHFEKAPFRIPAQNIRFEKNSTFKIETAKKTKKRFKIPNYFVANCPQLSSLTANFAFF